MAPPHRMPFLPPCPHLQSDLLLFFKQYCPDPQQPSLKYAGHRLVPKDAKTKARGGDSGRGMLADSPYHLPPANTEPWLPTAVARCSPLAQWQELHPLVRSLGGLRDGEAVELFEEVRCLRAVFEEVRMGWGLDQGLLLSPAWQARTAVHGMLLQAC